MQFVKGLTMQKKNENSKTNMSETDMCFVVYKVNMVENNHIKLCGFDGKNNIL